MTPKYWCKHFVPFSKLRDLNRTSTVRNARCWVLDNVDKDKADIFATDKGHNGGIAFAREEDLSMFLLVWA
jgi:hypothetical protein